MWSMRMKSGSLGEHWSELSSKLLEPQGMAGLLHESPFLSLAPYCPVGGDFACRSSPRAVHLAHIGKWHQAGTEMPAERKRNDKLAMPAISKNSAPPLQESGSKTLQEQPDKFWRFSEGQERGSGPLLTLFFMGHGTIKNEMKWNKTKQNKMNKIKKQIK